MTLRLKLLAGLLFILFLFVLTCVGLMLYVRAELQSSIMDSSRLLARSAGERMDYFLTHRISGLLAMVRREPEFLALMRKDDALLARMSPSARAAFIEREDRLWRSGRSRRAAEISRRTLSQLLRREQAVLATRSGEMRYGEIFVTNRYGVNVAQTNRTSDYRQDDEPWWTFAAREGTWVGDFQLDESSGIYSTEIALSLTDGQNRVLGVMKAVLNIRGVREELDRGIESIEYKSSFLEIFDRHRKLIYRTRGSNAVDLGAFKDEQNLKIPEGVDSLVMTYGGKKYLRAIARLRVSKWTIVVNVPYDEAMAPATLMTRFGTAMLFLGTLAAAFIATYLVRAISRPLAQLEESTQRIGTGDFSQSVALDRRDEFGVFSRVLDKMRIDIGEANLKLQNEMHERALAEERYRLLFTGTEDVILSLDEDLRIVEANNAVRANFGVNPEDMKSTALTEWLSFPTAAEFARADFDESLNELRREQKAIERPILFTRATDGSKVELWARFESLSLGDSEEVLLRASPHFENPLLRGLRFERSLFEIPNNVMLVDLFIDRLDQGLQSHCGDDERHEIKTGLREILINAIEHGNLDITNAEKSEALRTGTYISLFRNRLQDERYAERKIVVRTTIYAHGLRILVQDEGPGFDHDPFMRLERKDLAQSHKAHGRGIYFTRQFFDEVRYFPPGNTVLLVKDFQQNGDGR